MCLEARPDDGEAGVGPPGTPATLGVAKDQAAVAEEEDADTGCCTEATATATMIGRERRDVFRLVALTAWACAAGHAVSNVAYFPPATFRAVATEVYRQAQQATSCSTTPRVLELGVGGRLDSVFDGRFVPGSKDRCMARSGFTSLNLA